MPKVTSLTRRFEFGLFKSNRSCYLKDICWDSPRVFVAFYKFRLWIGVGWEEPAGTSE